MKLKLSSLIIAGVVNAVIISILESYDNRLASIYTILIFIIVIVTYRDEIFPAVNRIFGSIQNGISE